MILCVKMVASSICTIAGIPEHKNKIDTWDSHDNEAKPRERSDRDRFFAFRAKKPFHNDATICLVAKTPLRSGVRTGCHYLISLSVCLSVCNIRRFY